MKWPASSTNKENSGEKGRYLALPAVQEPRSVSAGGDTAAPPSAASSTGTWPPKRSRAPPPLLHLPPPPATQTVERPSTATLERPHLLDIDLLHRLDMSLVRKEFLCITNLCRMPLHARHVGPTPSPASSLIIQTSTSNCQSEDVDKKNARSRVKKISKSNRKNEQDSKQKKVSSVTSNRKAGAALIATVAAGQGKKASIVPAPCTTCGRTEQPERFHSHPPPRRPPPVEPAPTPRPMKNSVQKPVAIRYKSRKRIETPTVTAPAPAVNAVVPRPRTLTCYICAREFGTTSLPLHEPKCLQRWERENEELPRQLQRKAPTRPEVVAGAHQAVWNKLAWQASQANLAACSNCSRTFLPERLLVHARSCRPLAGPTQDMPGSPGPPAVRCYICGRMFGTKSIAIHEPQCLKKWRANNDQLPRSERLPTPVRPEPQAATPTAAAASDQQLTAPQQDTTGPSGKLPCYLCGRELSVPAIYTHETQCLKKWRAENDRLPPNQRRPEPQRPDVKFTASGSVDYVGTFHRIWENHLAELVPCRICGRRFFPDRIEKHEKACNNLPIKRKKK